MKQKKRKGRSCAWSSADAHPLPPSSCRTPCRLGLTSTPISSGVPGPLTALANVSVVRAESVLTGDGRLPLLKLPAPSPRAYPASPPTSPKFKLKLKFRLNGSGARPGPCATPNPNPASSSPAPAPSPSRSATSLTVRSDGAGEMRGAIAPGGRAGNAGCARRGDSGGDMGAFASADTVPVPAP
jgi:hypothetical protein